MQECRLDVNSPASLTAPRINQHSHSLHKGAKWLLPAAVLNVPIARVKIRLWLRLGSGQRTDSFRCSSATHTLAFLVLKHFGNVLVEVFRNLELSMQITMS